VALEQEIKLAFESLEAARRAVLTAGGRLVVSRRLLDDRLFDTADERLRRSGSAFRIRRDGDRTLLTFK
jgi:inorganic triphosphatase YgiF